MSKTIDKGRDFIKPLEPWHTIIVVPIWQEALFRWVPFTLWYQPTQNFWLVGIVSSILFASIHWYFGKWFVLYTFLGGFVLWWLMVNYGLAYAVLLHAAINIIDVSFGLRYKFSNIKREKQQ